MDLEEKLIIDLFEQRFGFFSAFFALPINTRFGGDYFKTKKLSNQILGSFLIIITHTGD